MMPIQFRRGFLILAALVSGVIIVAWVLAFPTAQAQTTITLDPEVRYQTIVGWEATADLPNSPNAPGWAKYYNQIMDRAVNELGINRIRLEIRSGAENNSDAISRYFSGETDFSEWKNTRYWTANDNEDPFEINWDGFNFTELDWHVENTVLPLQERLEARGERLSINLCYVAFRNGWYIHKDPEEYAELVLATYLHLQDKYGFVPETWEVILEPDLKRGMWSGTDIGNAIVATSRRLEEAGFTPAFVVPSVTNMANAVPYLQKIAAVPGAMDHVVEFSYHRYRGRSRENLEGIAALGKSFGIRTAMLEWWFGHGDYRSLHRDLKIGQVAAWQGRVLQGHFKVQAPRSLNPEVTLQREVRFNLQYFRDVRAGAVRIDAQSSNESRMDPLAFVNPDGSTTIVIKAERSGKIVVQGLPDGEYHISYATDRRSRVFEQTITVSQGSDLQSRIPDGGVLTVTSRRGLRD